MRKRMMWRTGLWAPLAMIVLSGVAHGQFYAANQASGMYGDETSSQQTPYGNEGQGENGYEAQQVSYNYADPDTSCTSCADGSCSSSCDSCRCCPLDDCNRCPNWYAGTEFTFLAFNTHAGARTQSAVSDGVTPFNMNAANGNIDGFTYAPRIWLGRQFGHWGVVVRYWYLNAFDGQNIPIIPPGQLQGGSFYQNVNMQTLDLEAVRSGCWCDWKLDGFFGVRYASFANSSATSAVGYYNGGLDLATSSAWAGTNFGGTGLTAALQGRRPLGCTNLYLFTNARGSVLWGNSTNYAHTEAGAISPAPAASALQASGAYVNQDATMWIGEFQVGVQWEYELCCLPAVAFFRTAFEYQYWGIQGGGFASSNAVAAANTTGSLAAAQSGASDIQLYGVSVGTGLTW